MLRYNIGKSIVNDICKSEESLKCFKMAKCELGILKSVKATKSMKTGMFEELDSALCLWFRQKREKPESLKPFTDSCDFQWRFCTALLSRVSIAGEKLSADLVSGDEFINSFGQLTAGYCSKQIFNCGATGHYYYKMLPGCTLTTVHNPSGTKKPKERITIF